MANLTPIAEWLNNCSTENWLEAVDVPGVAVESEEWEPLLPEIGNEDLFGFNHDPSKWLLPPSPDVLQALQPLPKPKISDDGSEWRSEVDALRQEAAEYVLNLFQFNMLEY